MNTRKELVRLLDFPKYSAQYIENDFDITEVPEFTDVAHKIIECVLEGVPIPDIFIVEKPDGMNVPLHPKAHRCLVATILGIQQGWITHPKYGPFDQWGFPEQRMFRMADICVISTPAGTADPERIELRKFITSFMYQGEVYAEVYVSTPSEAVRPRSLADVDMLIMGVNQMTAECLPEGELP